MDKEFNLVEKLREEQQLIFGKIERTREKGDYESYKRLISVLGDITRMIRDEESFIRKENRFKSINKK